MSGYQRDIFDEIKSAINQLYDVRIRPDFDQSLRDNDRRQALQSFYNAGHIYFLQLKDDLESNKTEIEKDNADVQ